MSTCRFWANFACMLACEFFKQIQPPRNRFSFLSHTRQAPRSRDNESVPVSHTHMHSRVLTQKTSGLASHAKPPPPPPPCHAPVTAPASCRALPALPPTHEPSPRIALTPHGHKGGRPLTPPTNVRNVRNGSTRVLLSMEALWWAAIIAPRTTARHTMAACTQAGTHRPRMQMEIYRPCCGA